jgi:hypothetical protein
MPKTNAGFMPAFFMEAREKKLGWAGKPVG